MNVITTQYVHDLQRLEIYLAGCRGVNGVHCKGCHNPQSWSFDNGNKIDVEALVEKARQPIVNNIWVLGGEPLDQPLDELIYLLDAIKGVNKPLWLFTRFNYQDVPLEVLNRLNYIKLGAYDENKKTNTNIMYGVKLATSNQKIIKLN